MEFIFLTLAPGSCWKYIGMLMICVGLFYIVQLLQKLDYFH